MRARGRRADLHIHTCLSPCADLSMSPRGIAARSRTRGLDIIAVCDHNSAENVFAVRKAAEGTGVEVLGGMELTTVEEVHLLAIFDRHQDENLLRLQEIVYGNLQGERGRQRGGEQVVASEEDEVLGFNDRPLVSATRLSVEWAVETIHSLGGLAVASHIDRQGFGILGQLGFIPPGLPLDAVEISSNTPCSKARETFRVDYPFITSSDAHFLDDIGKVYTTLGSLKDATVAEIRACLGRGEGFPWEP